MLIPEPESPQRSLRGESIRSLRGLLQASMALPELPESKEEPEQRDDKKTTEVTVKPITRPKNVRRDADQMRSRLLRNLGISKEAPRQTSPTPPNENKNNTEPWGPTTEEDLNDIWDITTLQKNEFANKKLQFHPIVKVIPIPSYKVYSQRIQQTIWTNAYELQKNVARNTLEFSYEQWDVHRVLDEDSGLICHEGRWIHPVHVEFVRPEGAAELTSEEELWMLTCDRLGIQPAEFYHSPLPTLQRGSQVSG